MKDDLNEDNYRKQQHGSEQGIGSDVKSAVGRLANRPHCYQEGRRYFKDANAPGLDGAESERSECKDAADAHREDNRQRVSDPIHLRGKSYRIGLCNDMIGLDQRRNLSCEYALILRKSVYCLEPAAVIHPSGSLLR